MQSRNWLMVSKRFMTARQSLPRHGLNWRTASRSWWTVSRNWMITVQNWKKVSRS